MNASIDSLLSLQEKDIALNSLNAKLAAIPARITAVKREIADVKKLLLQERSSLGTLELKRAEMRADRKALEEKAAKYKSQLSETKKNSDYTALNEEIGRLTQKASDIEGEELQILFDIDEKKEKLKTDEAAAADQIAKFNGKIDSIKSDAAELEKQSAAALDERNAAASGVDAAYLRAYEKLRDTGKRQPLVVPLKGDLCGGCFVKVSGEVDSQLKGGENAPIFCEMCGRMLYIP